MCEWCHQCALWGISYEMGGQQGKERHVGGGGGTLMRASRAKYRSGKDVRGGNIFTEHNG